MANIIMPPTLTRKMSSIEWLELLEEGAMSGKALIRSSSSSSLASSTGSCSRNSVESGISSLSSETCSSSSGHQQTNGIVSYLEVINILEQLQHLDLDVLKTKRLTSSDAKLLSYYKKIEELKATAKERTERNENPLKLKYKNHGEIRVKYGKRDILDMGSHLRNSWILQPANLPGGVQNYFENRSLFSRLDNIYPPFHVVNTCEDCDFQEIIYA